MIILYHIVARLLWRVMLENTSAVWRTSGAQTTPPSSWDERTQEKLTFKLTALHCTLFIFYSIIINRVLHWIVCKNHSIGLSNWKAAEAGWTAGNFNRGFEISGFCWGTSAESYRIVLDCMSWFTLPDREQRAWWWEAGARRDQWWWRVPLQTLTTDQWPGVVLGIDQN